MLNSQDISFRRMKMSDLPLMHRWLNEPHVHEWYDDNRENTLEAITERYAPEILGDKPTEPYIVLYTGKSVGFIQTYKVNDWPEFGDYLGYDDHTAAIDLFVGDTGMMGKGFGSLMLKKFLHEVVFANPDIQTCIIGPDPENKRAIRAYEKAGFRYVKTVQVPREHLEGEEETDYIMEVKRLELV